VLLASTGEFTAEHIAAARMVLLATRLCAIQITLHDIGGAFDWRPDAWGRLNVVTPFDHLSEDSHINCPLRGVSCSLVKP